jgi:putative ATP-dependent endonuclease of OLD family
LKSALIDSSSTRYQNGADVYIARIIKDILEDKEIIDVSQAHRGMKEVFMDHKSIKSINTKLKEAVDISNKSIELSVDMSSKNAWETTLTTYLDSVPFHYIGKGEQAIVKTKIALAHKKALDANVILLEEPENHLSHSKLSYLISAIEKSCVNKQIIISTHSSFVANKLGLEHLLLLNDKKHFPFSALRQETYNFFKKLAGYDTLRLLLCKKAILVEGDSDELIYQKAYRDKKGHLPIEDEIDVISVGTSFLNFLEVAKVIEKPTYVITDNDGDIANKIAKKYSEYLGDQAETKEYIKICYDKNINPDGTVPRLNYNTLEPNLIKTFGCTTLNSLFGKSYASDDELCKYMADHKTECALAIFESDVKYTFPQYILDAID